jgi:hypothetical protein
MGHDYRGRLVALSANNGDKHTSLLGHEINYSLKSFVAGSSKSNNWIPGIDIKSFSKNRIRNENGCRDIQRNDIQHDSITSLSIRGLYVTVSINDTQHSITMLCLFDECHHAECHYAECYYAECYYAECYYAECHALFDIMLSIANEPIMLSVVMQSVVMQSVIKLNVVAPTRPYSKTFDELPKNF